MPLPLIACVTWILLGIALAASPQQADPAPEPSSTPGTTSPVPSVRRFEFQGEESFAYETTADCLPLLGADGKERARLFFVYYRKIGERAPEERPVTFVYNGGPGSASLWLHLGALGPRRVDFAADGSALAATGQLLENEYSWLPFTDLVFVDPVGTGYSRPSEGHEQAEFSGVKEDIESVGDWIRAWTSTYGRWRSPKYLAGESYGTLRSAGLAAYLQDRHHLFLTGIVLVSTVLDFGTKSDAPGHDLPHVLLLPSLTATAWFHQRLPARLQELPLPEVLRAVEAFALGDYLSALARGDELPQERRGIVVTRLAEFTGLSAEFIDRAELRITLSRFVKELLRDQKRTVGRLDSRFLGHDRDAAGERYEYDPSMANIDGPFYSAINDYLRETLGYESPLPYESLAGAVGRWSYSGYENRHVNVGDELRQAMNKNPFLRVLNLAGVYDLATPYFAARYTLSHLGLPAERRDNLQQKLYFAGHMMYIHHESLVAMTRDVAEFYATDG